MFLVYQIGMVQDGETDIGVTDFFATLSRSQAVDFSTILHYAKYVRLPVYELNQDSHLSGLQSLLNFREEILEGSFLFFVATPTQPGLLCSFSS